MTIQFAHNLNLAAVECCACGITFAMPSSMQRRLYSDGGNFYCPSGHSQRYTKTEIQRLREKLDEQTRQATTQAERALQAEAETAKLQKKLKQQQRRHAAGTCPCCKRTFQQLARHIRAKHPGSAAEASA